MSPCYPVNITENYRYQHVGARIIKSCRATYHIRYMTGLECHHQLNKFFQVINLRSFRLRLDKKISQPCYLIAGLNGHLLSELNVKGQVISSEEYYPFGGTARWATRYQISHHKSLRYGGKERDFTGLIYYGYRYYAPWLMRWLNPDPAGTVDGQNMCRMCANNPVTLSDHDGRMWGAGPLSSEDQMSPGRALDEFNQYLILFDQQYNSVPPATTSGNTSSDITSSLNMISGHLNEPTSISMVEDISQPTITNLSSAEQSVTQKAPYICKWCKKEYTKASSLKRHQKTHTSGLKCSSCNLTFPSVYLQDQHNLIHSGEKNYQCPICLKRFTQNSGLDRHILIHEPSTLVCDICKRDFKTEGGLWQHQEFCFTGKNKHQCDLCTHAYVTAHALGVHKKSKHAPPRIWSCKICGKDKEFNSYWKLNKHNRAHHPKKTN